MDPDKSAEITDLLRAWADGDQAARDRLAATVYDELRRIARRYMRDERARVTLQTTVLVNEVYLRLMNPQSIEWQSRGQFFLICAQMMRRILVDAARARGAHKRGAGAVKIDIEAAAHLIPQSDQAVLRLNEALDAFAQVAPRQAQVVELRYFAGLSVQETVKAMNVSERTVMRDWDFAKAWLARELSR